MLIRYMPMLLSFVAAHLLLSPNEMNYRYYNGFLLEVGKDAGQERERERQERRMCTCKDASKSALFVTLIVFRLNVLPDGEEDKGEEDEGEEDDVEEEEGGEAGVGIGAAGGGLEGGTEGGGFEGGCAVACDVVGGTGGGLDGKGGAGRLMLGGREEGLPNVPPDEESCGCGGCGGCV